MRTAKWSRNVQGSCFEKKQVSKVTESVLALKNKYLSESRVPSKKLLYSNTSKQTNRNQYYSLIIQFGDFLDNFQL